MSVYYVVATPSGVKSPRLYEVRSNGGKLLGVVPDHEKWNSEPVDIRARDILVNLGEDPTVGTVYGCLVEPIVDRSVVSHYGTVYNYLYNMPEVSKARALKAFGLAIAGVRKLGPPCDWEMITEMRSPKGNKAGMYRYKPNDTDILTLYPIEGQSTRVLIKVISHELAHGVWYRYMTAEDRARWINLYERFVEVQEVSVQQIKQMITDMRQIGGVKAFVKDAEPEEAAAVDIYLSWLKKVHNCSFRELQDLLDVGSIKIPIPNTHLHRSAVDCPITLYSKTNAAEIFAEALSAYVVED